ncbi:MAG: hypothetical protein WA988_01390, partial [Candidatus Nanopelagicales bacterium]
RSAFQLCPPGEFGDDYRSRPGKPVLGVIKVQDGIVHGPRRSQCFDLGVGVVGATVCAWVLKTLDPDDVVGVL